jgi:hypothetical protein
MFQKDFFLFIFGVSSLTLTTIIWIARSGTELNFTRRCFRAFGFIKTVRIIFTFVYVKTHESNNSHWIQNIVTVVSFTVLAEYACRRLAEHGT